MGVRSLSIRGPTEGEGWEPQRGKGRAFGAEHSGKAAARSCHLQSPTIRVTHGPDEALDCCSGVYPLPPPPLSLKKMFIIWKEKELFTSWRLQGTFCRSFWPRDGWGPLFPSLSCSPNNPHSQPCQTHPHTLYGTSSRCHPKQQKEGRGPVWPPGPSQAPCPCPAPGGRHRWAGGLREQLPQLRAWTRAAQPAYPPPRACPPLLLSEGPPGPLESGAGGAREGAGGAELTASASALPPPLVRGPPHSRQRLAP